MKSVVTSQWEYKCNQFTSVFSNIESSYCSGRTSQTNYHCRFCEFLSSHGSLVRRESWDMKSRHLKFAEQFEVVFFENVNVKEMQGCCVKNGGWELSSFVCNCILHTVTF